MAQRKTNTIVHVASAGKEAGESCQRDMRSNKQRLPNLAATNQSFEMLFQCYLPGSLQDMQKLALRDLTKCNLN